MEQIKELFNGIVKENKSLITADADKTRFISKVFISLKSNAVKLKFRTTENLAGLTMQYGDVVEIELGTIIAPNDTFNVIIDDTLENSFTTEMTSKFKQIFSDSREFKGLKRGLILATGDITTPAIDTTPAVTTSYYFIYDYNFNEIFKIEQTKASLPIFVEQGLKIVGTSGEKNYFIDSDVKKENEIASDKLDDLGVEIDSKPSVFIKIDGIEIGV